MGKHRWLTRGEEYGADPDNPDPDDDQPYGFGFESGFHNGPRCTACGFTGCHHCNPGVYDDDTCPVIDVEVVEVAPKELTP